MALKMPILFDRCQVWNSNYDFYGRLVRQLDPLPWKVAYGVFTDSFANHADALLFAVKGGRNGIV